MKMLMATLLGLLAWQQAQGKPIAYARGTTFMMEYGSGHMQEAQLFYAPRYLYSHGGDLPRMEARDRSFDREIAYLSGTLLAKRWNLPSAQGNVFAFGGPGAFAEQMTTVQAGFAP